MRLLPKKHSHNNHLVSVFTAYRYLPLLNDFMKAAPGHESKLDELIKEAATIGNAEWIVQDMNHAEPFKVLAHMNQHTSRQLIDGMMKQYF